MRAHSPFFPRRAPGFTLVEMIVVIVLSGIVLGMVAVFIRSPIEAYVDSANRARLTEAADTAMRYFARDLRSALPNSVRVSVVGGVHYLQFVPTVGGARYRQFITAGNAADPLDFSAADTAFDIIGPVPAFAVGDSVVVFNLEPGSVSDVYSGNNRAALTTASAEGFSTDLAPVTVNLAAGSPRFPAPSPGARFHFVTAPVTYECNPTVGVQQLRRYAGNPFAAIQPTPPAGAFSRLADNVSACTITYDPAVTSMRTGLVILSLTLTLNGENVNLVHQVHVQNMP